MIKATIHLIVEDLERTEVVALRQKIQAFLDSETRAWLKVFVAEEVLSRPESEPEV